MIPFFCFVVILFGFFHSSQSLQSGYTCETSVTLTCPQASKLVIIEVSYSSECPTIVETPHGGAIYAPSHCLGYDRDRIASICNGKRICTIDHRLEHRPSFNVGKQSNCAFKGQSFNVEYSCVPEFYSSKLPRIDICSLQSLNDLTEGFLHTPSYPNGYPNSQTCSKTVPAPAVGHRLKIFSLDFDIEGLSFLRFFGLKRTNDWLQINNSGEKMFGTRPAFTLLFDDVIEASLMFKSDFANSKRPYNGFLLYFIVVPIRGVRPLTTTTSTEKTLNLNETLVALLSNRNEDVSSTSNPKVAALVLNDHSTNNVGLTLLVVLLSAILFVIVCAFLLYKRRNDRRVRYLSDLFNSFFPSRSTNVTLNTTENLDETTLNNTIISKLDVSVAIQKEKSTKFDDDHEEFLRTPTFKRVNINEKRLSQEKEVFIENLKTCPSPLSSTRLNETKFNSKEQIPTTNKLNSNIYSADPLSKENSTSVEPNRNSSLYETVDLPIRTAEQQDDVIYDVINTTNERSEYDSVLYAVPKTNN